MKYEGMIPYEINESHAMCEIHMGLDDKDNGRGCLNRVDRLLRAYYGDIRERDSYLDSFIAKATGLTEDDENPKAKTLTDDVIGYLLRLAKEKWKLEKDYEAEDKLRFMFGVSNLKEAQDHKLMYVLERLVRKDAG